MKEIIQVETTEWRNIPGNAILEVTDFSPSEFARLQSSPNPQGALRNFLKHPTTIGQWKQRFGGTQTHLNHPASNKKFLFDLSPWSHLPDDTYLLLDWKFVPLHPIFRTKP